MSRLDLALKGTEYVQVTHGTQHIIAEQTEQFDFSRVFRMYFYNHYGVQCRSQQVYWGENPAFTQLPLLAN